MRPDVASSAEEGAEQAAPSGPDRPFARSTFRLTHWIASRTGFDDRAFVLRVVQPALVGMIDGTVSTLAPIFAAAISSSSHTALVVGIATALGAGVSMGFSEALSDTGEETGRGSAVVRGAITGAATAFGGVFHSLPFIIHDVHTALIVAGAVVAVELFVISWVRYRFLHVPLRNSMVVVTGAGAIVVAIGVLIGGS
jgi:erythrin-vacuolar iron transport family protein